MTDAWPLRRTESMFAATASGCGSYGRGAGVALGDAPPAFARRLRIECGVLPFLIRRDGAWLYRGSVVQRKELVCLLASVLKRDRDGAFWLETRSERGRIEVEDAPFVAVELDWRGHDCGQTLSFRTNVDQCVTVDEEHPLRVHRDPVTGEPTPYILVRPGEGSAGLEAPGLEARVNRATYYELVALAVPETVGGHRQLGVWSCQRFFPLGDVPSEEDDADWAELGGAKPGGAELDGTELDGTGLDGAELDRAELDGLDAGEAGTGGTG